MVPCGCLAVHLIKMHGLYFTVPVLVTVVFCLVSAVLSQVFGACLYVSIVFGFAMIVT